MNKINTGVFILSLISAGFILLAAPENLGSLAGVGYMIGALYFFHLNRTNRSFFDVKVDYKLIMPFVALAVLFFMRGLFVDTDISPCAEGCKKDEDSNLCVSSTDENIACETKNMNQEGFFGSPVVVICSSILTTLAFIFYESAHNKGMKEAGYQAATILISGLVIFFMIYVLFGLGNPYYVFTENEDTKTVESKRNDYIFKGGLRGDIFNIFDFNVNKIIYEGDPLSVKVQNEKNDDKEPVSCSHTGNGGDDLLWKCRQSEHNRIESKCGGDWWLTSDKGCLSDGFTKFYQFIYIIIIGLLVSVSMYSAFSSPNFYSFKTFQPMILGILILFIYHIVYLSTNFFVSWSQGEAILFQDFVSEFLKGRKGYWTSNEECDRIYKSRIDPETTDPPVTQIKEGKYETIWEKEDATSKIKIVINVVLLIMILGYTVNYTGNKYIQKFVSSMDTLEGKTKNAYIILITLLISFSAVQFVYLIYSTIMIDECIIDRITGVTHKIDYPDIQKYCKGKISMSDQTCQDNRSKEECKGDSEQCIYDNSYTIPELIRCQLDRHGGLLYHIIVLLILPILFLFIKSANIPEYFK